MSEQNNTGMIFKIQRIYAKDVSFEAPNIPKLFQQKWQPEIKLDIDITSNKLSEDIYEVILKITVTALLIKDIAFLCEVHQAGIFTILGIQDAQIAHCLGVHCPNILFPYASECISNQVARGTFPQLNLTPINFNALFLRNLQQHQENNKFK